MITEEPVGTTRYLHSARGAWGHGTRKKRQAWRRHRRKSGAGGRVGAKRDGRDLAHREIKAKMALDDTVRARVINVTTNGTVVTISGTVGSASERERAIALTRETDGVSRVVDQLRISR